MKYAVKQRGGMEIFNVLKGGLLQSHCINSQHIGPIAGNLNQLLNQLTSKFKLFVEMIKQNAY